MTQAQILACFHRGFIALLIAMEQCLEENQKQIKEEEKRGGALRQHTKLTSRDVMTSCVDVTVSITFSKTQKAVKTALIDRVAEFSSYKIATGMKNQS